MNAFYAACPDTLVPQKQLLLDLVTSYRSFSLGNNWKRMLLFFSNYKLLLTVKRYSTGRKPRFCLKMFGQASNRWQVTPIHPRTGKD